MKPTRIITYLAASSALLLSSAIIWAQAMGPLGSFQAPIQNWGTAAGARYNPPHVTSSGLRSGMTSASPSTYTSYGMTSRDFRRMPSQRREPPQITDSLTGRNANRYAINRALTAGFRF
jgi:hypothetical protein